MTKIEEDMVTDGKDFSPKKGKKKSSTTGMDHGHEPYAQDISSPKVADITPEELFNKIEELDRQMRPLQSSLNLKRPLSCVTNWAYYVNNGLICIALVKVS